MGLRVNALEEYEYNTVFAGRNWNAGATIELVLRRPDHTLSVLPLLLALPLTPSRNSIPYKFIIMVMSHELAHIKQMNHSSKFDKVNNFILTTVTSLMRSGFTGVGFWGKGKTMEGDQFVPLQPGDLPQFTWSISFFSLHHYSY